MAQAWSGSLGSSAPIGVFDSGVGGLSVLQALRAELPAEQFIYVADSGHAPYGERGDAFVVPRTHDIARYLVEQHRIKALVVACNTATAAAMDALRQAWPQAIAMVGVEPAVKPAARSSQTHHVGVMGTRGTVRSLRFARLLEQHGAGVQFHVQACDGLARAIEDTTQPELPSAQAAAQEVQQLCAAYLSQLGPFGLKTGEMDTLVLGCTHYVFVKDVLRALVGPDVQLVDTGAAVARQTRRLLEQSGQLRYVSPPLDALAGPDQIQLQTTGSLPALQAAAQRWLGLPASCCTALDLPLSVPMLRAGG